MVDESASQQKINDFKQKKAQSDAELAKKAVAAIKQANQKREQQGGDVPSGPTVIGRKIKSDDEPMQLINIEDEEKSVVVQGYVFSKEIRDLRSGRKLMILEITDYSSSIVVKKFSRDDGDEAQFEGLTKVIGSRCEVAFKRTTSCVIWFSMLTILIRSLCPVARI